MTAATTPARRPLVHVWPMNAEALNEPGACYACCTTWGVGEGELHVEGCERIAFPAGMPEPDVCFECGGREIPGTGVCTNEGQCSRWRDLAGEQDFEAPCWICSQFVCPNPSACVAAIGEAERMGKPSLFVTVSDPRTADFCEACGLYGAAPCTDPRCVVENAIIDAAYAAFYPDDAYAAFYPDRRA